MGADARVNPDYAGGADWLGPDWWRRDRDSGRAGTSAHVRVPVSEARFRVRTDPTVVRAVVPARRRIFVLMFLCAWLVGWGFGEVSVVVSIANGHAGGSVVFLLAWLVGWTLGGAFALFAVAWMAMGSEVITISPDYLSIVHRVGPARRTREYAISDVQRLRVSPASVDVFSPTAQLRFLGLSGGPVAFDYGSRTYRFGAGLDEAEAESLVTTLCARLPPAASGDRVRSS